MKIAELVAPTRFGRSFRWLLGSSVISNAGDGIALAAGPLLVASVTQDPVLVASAAFLLRLPWLLFGVVALGIVLNTLVETPRESGFGLAFIALGIPVYLVQRAVRRRAA